MRQGGEAELRTTCDTKQVAKSKKFKNFEKTRSIDEANYEKKRAKKEECETS